MKGKRGDTTNWKHCECGDVAWTYSHHHVLLIDAVDTELYEIARRNWWAAPRENPVRVHGTRFKGEPHQAYLHQLLHPVPPGRYVDHINRNPLDNRQCNLRTVTPSQNAMNRRRQSNMKGPYKGVWLHKKTGKWDSEVNVRGKRYRLGLFDTPEKAKEAYDAAVKRLHGEYAVK